MTSGPARDRGDGGIPRSPGPAAQPPPTQDQDQPSEVVYYCDLCGNRMLDLHCKLVCETCGYRRDCSDP